MSIGGRRLLRVGTKPSAANRITMVDAFSRSWGWIATSTRPESNLTDTDNTTIWSAKGDPANIPVHIRFYLGGKYTLSKFSIEFAANSVKTYSVCLSDDNKLWSKITTETTTQNQITKVDITDFTAKPQAAYIMIDVLETWTTTGDVTINDVSASGVLAQAAPFGTLQHVEATPSRSGVHLAWDFLGTPLQKIDILRDGSLIGTLPAASRAYVDKTALRNASYNYTVRATYREGSTVSATKTMVNSGENTGKWLSGVACSGFPDGPFSAWRGRSASITTNWANDDLNMVNLWNMDVGFESHDWSGSMDLCIGSFTGAGETWAQAASGAYDAMWTASLNKAKERWTRISRGILYLRFAHEMNGNWFAWQVRDSEVADFRTAWQRFYSLKQSIFPEAQLVFSTNSSTSGFSYDWQTLWPGDAYVDVYSTDWYGFAYKAAIVDGQLFDAGGGPVGLEQHRQFAYNHGKPFAISEWGVSHDSYSTGDDANYIQYMFDFARANGGTEAGNLLYEVYFNLTHGYENAQFQIFYPDDQSHGNNPLSAARYKQTFGSI